MRPEELARSINSGAVAGTASAAQPQPQPLPAAPPGLDQNAAAVLAYLRTRPAPVSLANLVNATRLPAPAVRAALQTLVPAGLVEARRQKWPAPQLYVSTEAP
jgi:hypothetical protein